MGDFRVDLLQSSCTFPSQSRFVCALLSLHILLVLLLLFRVFFFLLPLALLDHILDVFLLFHLFLFPQTCFCLSVVERIQELIRPMLSLQLAYLRL